VAVLNAIKNFFNSGFLKPKYNINSLDEAKNYGRTSHPDLTGPDGLIRTPVGSRTTTTL
jgi:hypothetical protein